MFEHFSNCHGELNALMALITSFPLIGMWFSAEFVDRWFVRWFKPISSIGDDKSVRAVWGSELEVISASR